MRRCARVGSASNCGQSESLIGASTAPLLPWPTKAAGTVIAVTGRRDRRTEAASQVLSKRPRRRCLRQKACISEIVITQQKACITRLSSRAKRGICCLRPSVERQIPRFARNDNILIHHTIPRTMVRLTSPLGKNTATSASAPARKTPLRPSTPNTRAGLTVASRTLS